MSEALNKWFDVHQETPSHEDENVRRIFFLTSVDDPAARRVLIVKTRNQLQEELEVGAFDPSTTQYTHWLEWFPDEDTFSVSITNMQEVDGSAAIPPPPSAY